MFSHRSKLHKIANDFGCNNWLCQPDVCVFAESTRYGIVVTSFGSLQKAKTVYTPQIPDGFRCRLSCCLGAAVIALHLSCIENDFLKQFQ